MEKRCVVAGRHILVGTSETRSRLRGAGVIKPKSMIVAEVDGYKTMVDSIQNLINQSNADDTATVQSLYAYYSYAMSERNLAIDELKRFDLKATFTAAVMDTLLNVLDNYDIPQDQQKAEQVKLYLSNADYQTASSLVAELRTMGGYDSFCDYMDLLIGLQQTGASDSTLLSDPNKLNTLQAVADDKTSTESAAADELLKKLMGDNYEEWIEPNETSAGKRAIVHKPSTMSSLSKNGSMSVFPNPANDQTTVNITMANDMQSGLFAITDVTGRILVTMDVLASGSYTFDTETFAKGIYFCTLRNANNHKVTDRVKLVIIK